MEYHSFMCLFIYIFILFTLITLVVDGLCCRFVLAVGSAVFDAMFNGGMATTSTEIELPDVEPAAFLSLLKYDSFVCVCVCIEMCRH